MSHNHSVKENTGQIIGIAALGAFIGAGLAMLMAPKNGNETRAELKDKLRSMKTKTQNYKTEITEAANNAEEIVSKAKQDADTVNKPKRSTKETDAEK